MRTSIDWDALTHITCRECGLEKEKRFFEKRYDGSPGYRRQCKKCKNYKNNLKRDHFARRLKVNYGLTPIEYYSMLEDQGGVCIICKASPEESKLRFPVDHCHTTNVNRGILCNRCNTGIGQFLDSPELLREAASYLERSNNLH